jgi:hypothetical protein
MISRKNNLICTHNEVNKNNIIWEAAVLVLLTGVIMKYTVEMASDGMLYVPSLMDIGLGIQVILKLLPRQCARLKCL